MNYMKEYFFKLFIFSGGAKKGAWGGGPKNSVCLVYEVTLVYKTQILLYFFRSTFKIKKNSLLSWSTSHLVLKIFWF